MQTAYQVPKRSVPAEIVLAGQPPLAVRLFLSESAQTHAGFERPSDLLNGRDDFLPGADPEDRVIFFHRDAVLTVSVDAEAEFGGEIRRAEDLVPDQATSAAVEIHLENGKRLSGVLVYLLPEASRRLQDLLNQPARFLTLRDGDRARLINKSRIVRITPA